MLIIGTTSPTNPPAKTSLNDYEQQHDNLVSKILSPSLSSQNKKNPNPTSSSSSSSSWLRTEHYNLTTAKQEDLQWIDESTSTRNEELREKGISQNLSIVSFYFSCLPRIRGRERKERKGKERKRKRKERKEEEKHGCSGKIIYWLFSLAYLLTLLCFTF